MGIFTSRGEIFERPQYITNILYTNINQTDTCKQKLTLMINEYTVMIFVTAIRGPLQAQTERSIRENLFRFAGSACQLILYNLKALTLSYSRNDA